MNLSGGQTQSALSLNLSNSNSNSSSRSSSISSSGGGGSISGGLSENSNGPATMTTATPSSKSATTATTTSGSSKSSSNNTASPMKSRVEQLDSLMLHNHQGSFQNSFHQQQLQQLQQQQLAAAVAAAAAAAAQQQHQHQNQNLNLNQQVNNNQHQSQLQQQVDSIEANKGYTFEEQFKQLYDLSDDPKRKEFLDDLFQFMADRNQPVNRIPIMAKQVLDLYELYNLVVARGGLVEVINKKIWREITKGLNLPSSITSAAFTLRTQYMKYLYPYECAKNNFSHQDELQQAIDGNRREGRRAGGGGSLGGLSLGAAGGGGGSGASGYNAAAAYLSGADQNLSGRYSTSPSPNQHLFAAAAAAAAAQQHHGHSHHHHHHLLSQAAAMSQAVQANQPSGAHQLQLSQVMAAAASHLTGANQSGAGPNQQQNSMTTPAHHHNHHQQQQQSPSSASPPLPQSPANQFNNLSNHLSSSQHLNHLNHLSSQHQRLYQDSIESDQDEDDEGSIDLGDNTSKRNSPIIDHEHNQHLDSHNTNNHLNQQQANAAEQQQQQLAAAIRQQLGAAFNLAGAPSFLSQLTSGLSNLNPANHASSGAKSNIPQVTRDHATSTPNLVSSQANDQQNGADNPANQGDLLKHQQEQFLAALMAASNQQQGQQQQQQPQHATPGAIPDQQAAAKAALSMVASNAMLIAAPNAPDAMAIAAAAQAIGVKGAFIILLL